MIQLIVKILFRAKLRCSSAIDIHTANLGVFSVPADSAGGEHMCLA